MKVFISWSGKRSKALANALKEWIPHIVQHAEMWVSDKDISAGDRWAQEISGELESSNFGILCITPENLSSEWILFEAGALSKSMQDSKVIPLLFGLELQDLRPPLSQFQALKVDEQGMLNALKAINSVSETKTKEDIIDSLVPALWPRLQEKLDDIPEKEDSEKHMRPQTEILEDLVSQVRGLNGRMREYDPEHMERDLKFRDRSFSEFDPRMFDELMHVTMNSRGADFSLVLLAGFVRDKMPWLAEVLVEAHRELNSASHGEAREIAQKLQQIVKFSTRSEWAERTMMKSKRSHMLMMEMPMFVDRAISHRLEKLPFKDTVDRDEEDIGEE